MSVTVAVANYYIRRAESGGIVDLNPVKLHDLVYFAQGWRLGQSGQPLLAGAIMAYRDGVYVRELRDEGCWGTRRIEEPISVFMASETARGLMKEDTPQLARDEPALQVLDWVWQTYGGLTPYETSRLAREPGGPWDQVWNTAAPHSDDPLELPMALMRQWFQAEFKLRMGRMRTRPEDTLGGESDFSGEDTQRVFRSPDKESLRPV